jgi:hypothetical protein
MLIKETHLQWCVKYKRTDHLTKPCPVKRKDLDELLVR